MEYVNLDVRHGECLLQYCFGGFSPLRIVSSTSENVSDFVKRRGTALRAIIIIGKERTAGENL